MSTLFEPDKITPTTEPPVRLPWFDDFARDTQSLPDGWRWASWSTSANDTPKGFVRLTGAAYPNTKKGKPNWAKRDKNTDRTLFLNIADFEAWKARLAAKQCVCAKCFGSGKEWAGWSRDAGNTFRVCQACDGSGKPVSGVTV